MTSWLSHFVYAYDLSPGDHIYVYRSVQVNSHHGIFIEYGGTPSVVHFVRDVTRGPPQTKIKLSTLNDFRQNDFGSTASLRRYRYGVGGLEYYLKRGSTCTTKESDSDERVVQRAWDCYNGKDDVSRFENSEQFALYCKLGDKFP
ncbi:uncharacterized protein LOC144438843 [Glandiceps talaboti]